MTSPASAVAAGIRKVQHLLRLKTDDALQSAGLTTPRYLALTALSAQPGLSGAALARRCLVTPQTMTGIIAGLAAAGLIARTPDPEHGRVIQTRLTDKGVALLARARTSVERVEADMVRDLDRAEREALADLLAHCADALAKRTPQQSI